MAPKHGFWIQTHSGVAFDLSAPTPDMIQIDDVARSLARLCRFTGHCARHYSVSEHSRHVAAAVAATNPEWALAALLHEVEEAYIGDLSSPFKALLRASGAGDALTYITAAIKRAAAVRFRLDLYKKSTYRKQRIEDHCSMLLREAAIKQADLRMLATERRDLMPASPDWGASWFAATGHAAPEPYVWPLAVYAPNSSASATEVFATEVTAFLGAFVAYGGSL